MASLSPTTPEIAVADNNDEQKRLKRQRMRSLAIAFGLGFLVFLFYAATIVRMGK